MDDLIRDARLCAEIVNEWVNQLRSFTAHDVTEEVKSRVSRMVLHGNLKRSTHAVMWTHLLAGRYECCDKSFPGGDALLYMPGQELIEDKFENMIEVDSSWIGSIGYNIDSGLIMVRLLNGKHYTYQADADMFVRFLNAESKGQFLNEHLKGDA